MTSHKLSELTKISNKEITNYYWYLENIVMYRKAVECVPVIELIKENYLTSMSESLILMILVKFKKENIIDHVFVNYK